MVNRHQTEENERRAEEERQRRALEQARDSAAQDSGFLQSIIDAIRGFFEFLMNVFSGRETGDGDRSQRNPRGSGGVGAIVSSGSAARIWGQYQGQHQGETVVHRSPVEGSSGVGDDRHMRESHPITHDRRMHHGVDITPRGGSAAPNILASADGVVLYSDWINGYGNTVIIGHADGTYSLYGHMTGTRMPEAGIEVHQGQVIGVMGMTGGATGVHLHYEQRHGSDSIVPLIEGHAAMRGTRLHGDAHEQAVAAASSSNLPPQVRAQAEQARAHPRLPMGELHGSVSVGSPTVFSAARTAIGTAIGSMFG